MVGAKFGIAIVQLMSLRQCVQTESKSKILEFWHTKLMV